MKLTWFEFNQVDKITSVLHISEGLDTWATTTKLLHKVWAKPQAKSLILYKMPMKY